MTTVTMLTGEYFTTMKLSRYHKI